MDGRDGSGLGTLVVCTIALSDNESTRSPS